MNGAGRRRKVSIEVGNTIAEMRKVVELVDRFGAANHVPQRVVNDLNLCLDELLNNTISYGYEDARLHRIVVRLSLSNNRLVAEIKDDAKPFDPNSATAVPPDGTLEARQVGGLGIHFVKTLVDELGYIRRGRYNVVKITKRLGEESNGDH
jgi:serine/threonine-protein kinase RsbW